MLREALSRKVVKKSDRVNVEALISVCPHHVRHTASYEALAHPLPPLSNPQIYYRYMLFVFGSWFVDVCISCVFAMLRIPSCEAGVFAAVTSMRLRLVIVL